MSIYCNNCLRERRFGLLHVTGQTRPSSASMKSSRMASSHQDLSSLTNPLITPDQLVTSSSQLDGIPADLEASLRYAGAQLTQSAGILLRLPQDLIAQAIVIFYRFFTGPEGGSFRINGIRVSVSIPLLSNSPCIHSSLVS